MFEIYYIRKKEERKKYMDEKMLKKFETMIRELMEQGVSHEEIENAVDRAVERYQARKILANEKLLKEAQNK